MGTDIANSVQKQVDEQLRQLGIAASSSARSNSCGQIVKACKQAGFGKGNGIGLFTDCVDPLMQGKPQPQAATIPLPHVDPQTIAACKQASPEFGRLRHRKPPPSSPDPDSDQDKE